MNCVECRELLAGYIEGLLDTQQKEAIVLHLAGCAACRTELEQAKTLQNHLVTEGRQGNQGDLEIAVMNRIVREQAFKLRKVNQDKQHVNFWRLIMRNRLAQLAAAAVILIAVLAGIYFLTGKPPVVTCCAWAQIADRVAQFKTCVYRVHSRESGEGVEVESKIYISSDYGYKMETVVDGNMIQQQYMMTGDKAMIIVMPPPKKYMLIALTDEILVHIKNQMQDPRDMVTKFMSGQSGQSGQYKELGKDTINGVEVKGIEVNKPPPAAMTQDQYSKFTGRMWVDVATEYPVRMEMEGERGTGAQKTNVVLVMDGFEWGAALSPDLFEPNIPADYTMMDETGAAGMKMPAQDETGAIEGFRFFAELTEGKYPSQMNAMSAVIEAQEGLIKRVNATPGVEPNDQVRQELMGKASKLRGPFIFYQKLAQEGNEPVYHGDKVSAEFGDAVLMRWKVGDKQYRVIFGDLTVDTVSADELAELEAMPLNRNPRAIKPTPADGAVCGKITDLQLSWMPGIYSSEHKVYIGTAANKLSLLADVPGDNNVIVPDLQRDTTYYWRVDEIDANDMLTTGDTWSFNTGKLVGWWKLDETTGSIAYDSSGLGNNGSLQG